MIINKEIMAAVDNPELYNGECIEIMRSLPDNSVDMVFCDLPYGTTNCKWDAVIPFEDLWLAYRRIVKHDGAMVFTASQPFTTALISSNINAFSYAWVWDKKFAGNFVKAKHMPLRVHEDVLVFCQSGKIPAYTPQITYRDIPIKKGGNRQAEAIPIKRTATSAAYTSVDPIIHTKMPTTILEYSNRTSGDRGSHPTQKPVALMEYLIKTYSKEGDVVLDNCMGSGSTGVAAKRCGRRFIGIEKEQKYYTISQKRIAEQDSYYQVIGEI